MRGQVLSLKEISWFLKNRINVTGERWRERERHLVGGTVTLWVKTNGYSHALLFWMSGNVGIKNN